MHTVVGHRPPTPRRLRVNRGPSHWSARLRHPAIAAPQGSAVAGAEVQVLSSGTSRPLARKRADRFRRVGIELLVSVSTRNGSCSSRTRARKRSAPGIACSSWCEHAVHVQQSGMGHSPRFRRSSARTPSLPRTSDAPKRIAPRAILCREGLSLVAQRLSHRHFRGASSGTSTNSTDSTTFPLISTTAVLRG